MTTNQKKTIIFKDINSHYDEFLRQSYMKVDKRYANQPNDHIELVSDVIHSIVCKFEDKDQLERFYEMSVNSMLFNFIVKAINTNAKSLNAPFLRNKLKLRNRIQFDENLYKDTYERTEWDDIVDDIYESFEPPNAERIYGPDWKYYITIFKEYVEDKKCSYERLSRKYNIPKSSIARDINTMKIKVRKYLKYENN